MQDSCAQTRLRESWSARKLDRPHPCTTHRTHYTPHNNYCRHTMGPAAAAHPPLLPSPSPSTAHAVPKNSQSPSCHPVGAAVYRRLSPSEIGGGGGVERERRESEDAPGACTSHERGSESLGEIERGPRRDRQREQGRGVRENIVSATLPDVERDEEKENK